MIPIPPLSSRTLNYGNPISNNPLNVGLVSRWQVLPARGKSNTLFDLAGDNHGTLTNGPTWQGALGRKGGNGSMEIAFSDTQTAYVAATTAAMSDYTVSFWIRYVPTAFRSVNSPGWDGSGSFGRFDPTESGGDLTARWRVEFGFATGNVIPTSTWHNVTATRSGAVATIYQNGVQTGTNGAVATTATGTAFTVAGAYGGTSATIVQHQIDGTTIHSRALSVAEVMAWHLDSLAGSPQTLNWISSKTYFGVTAAAGAFTKITGRPTSLAARGGGLAA